MTLKIGTLQVDINAETSGLKKAEAEVGKSSERIGKELGDIQKAADNVVRGGFTPMGAASEKMGSVLNKNQHKVQQFGFQIQDIAVQLQAGTKASVVFAQQGSQIASIFGPGGAAIGAILAVSASVAGPFIASLFGGSNAAEDLEKALEELDKVMKQTGDGTFVLTKQIEELAKRSSDAAKLELEKSMVDALAAADLAMTAFGNTANDTNFALSDMSKEFGLTSNEMQSLAKSQMQAFSTKSAEDIAAYQREVVKLALSAERTDSFVKFASEVRKAGDAVQDSAARIDSIQAKLLDFDGAMRNSTETAIKNKDAVEKQIESLIVQRDTLGLSSAELEVYKAGLKNASDAQLILIRSISLEIQAQKDLEESRKNAEAERKRAEQQEQARQKSAQPGIKRIGALGETDRQEIERQFADNFEFIRAQTQLTEDMRTDLMTKAALERRDQIQRIEQEQAQQTITAMSGLTSSISGLLQATGDDQAARAASLISAVSQTAITLSTLATAQAQAQMLGDPSAITLPQKLANVATVVSLASNIFSVIRAAKGGGRSSGGNVSPSLAHPINENGTPEILNQAGRQFLLPTGKGGTITPMSSGSTGGGGVNISVINNTPATVTTTQLSKTDIQIMIDQGTKRAEDRINSSLATGRGATAIAAKRGLNVEPRLGGA